MRNLRISPARVIWTFTAYALAAVTLLTVFGPWSERTWEQPELLFSLVTVAAASCVIAATVVIALADRREMAEIGLLGTALMAASVLPLVHGLVTPGVLYDSTAAFRTAAFLSLPIAVAVAAPLLRPHSRFGRWAARRWRDWTLLSLLGVFAVASAVVFFPDAVTVPGPTEPLTIAVSLAMAAALGLLSLRQLRFYEVGRRGPNLVASISLLMLGVYAMLPMSDTSYNGGFWWMHVAGALGVMSACLAMSASKMSRSAQDVLAPVLARDPLAAFELGLSPVVHQFVADLDKKDQMTRDHVVRTGEMAMRVGERFRLPARELRDLGLAAMLHDVGKLRIPDEVLKKPTSLTAEEFELMKLHTVYGEEMLAAEPALSSAAPIVRSHHERPDGTGYPDALSGKEIPLPARIIAVCDAFDAMTHDRPYRRAMSMRLALAMLESHSDSQWDGTVVEQLKAALPSIPTVGAFDAVGRHVDPTEPPDEMPDDLTGLLASVDAEI